MDSKDKLPQVPAVEIEGLNVAYDRKRVLSSVYLNLPQGLLYGVLGPNGAGKSTLFKAILDLIEVDTGKVLVLGKPAREQHRELVYVPQRDDVDWDFPATVQDVVKMGRYAGKRPWLGLNAADREAVEGALNRLGIAHLRDRQIGQLSGGQQQRVFLARAMAQEAKIWLLDEPFVGVDATTEANIMELLHELSREGRTILVIHHDLSTVRLYFDRVILINQRIIAEGEVESTLTESKVSETFGAQMNLVHRTNML